jgi:DNA repair exonuclease SbcCD ATPase subunit
VNHEDRQATTNQEVQELGKVREHKLIGRVAELQRQIDQLAGDMRAAQALMNEREQQLAEITHSRDEYLKLCDEQTTRINELLKASEDLKLERDAFGAQAADLREQVGQLTDTTRADWTLLNEHKNQLREKIRELEHISRERDEQARLAEERLSHCEKLLSQEADLKKQLLEARQTASLSVKLQMLRESDLKDLQDRYQASRSAQERQHQMLVSLGERLRIASGYFHQLANPTPETSLDNQPASQMQMTRTIRASAPSGRKKHRPSKAKASSSGSAHRPRSNA